MDMFVRHLRVLGRAESLVTEIRLRRMMRRAGLFAFAGLIVLFGLAMVNLAVYQALVPRWGEAWAAGCVAGADFLIALILVLAGSIGGRKAELDLALELRQSAMAELEAQMRDVGGLVKGLGRHPLDALLPGLLMPALTMIVGMLRKGKGKK